VIDERVTAVMKGMEACFVDIGAEKAGFLSFATRGDDDSAPADIPNEGAVVLVQVSRAAQGGKGAGLTRSLSL
jgi:Ribonuclease G/E